MTDAPSISAARLSWLDKVAIVVVAVSVLVSLVALNMMNGLKDEILQNRQVGISNQAKLDHVSEIVGRLDATNVASKEGQQANKRLICAALKAVGANDPACGGL